MQKLEHFEINFLSISAEISLYKFLTLLVILFWTSFIIFLRSHKKFARIRLSVINTQAKYVYIGVETLIQCPKPPPQFKDDPYSYIYIKVPKRLNPNWLNFLKWTQGWHYAEKIQNEKLIIKSFFSKCFLNARPSS